MKIKISKTAVNPSTMAAVIQSVFDQLSDQKLDVHSATLYVNVCTSSFNPQKIIFSDKGKEVSWTVTQRELTHAEDEGFLLDRVLYDENGKKVGYLYRDLITEDEEATEE